MTGAAGGWLLPVASGVVVGRYTSQAWVDLDTVESHEQCPRNVPLLRTDYKVVTVRTRDRARARGRKETYAAEMPEGATRCG